MRKQKILFEVWNFSLTSSDCSLIFYAFAFAFDRCERALTGKTILTTSIPRSQNKHSIKCTTTLYNFSRINDLLSDRCTHRNVLQTCMFRVRRMMIELTPLMTLTEHVRHAFYIDVSSSRVECVISMQGIKTGPFVSLSCNILVTSGFVCIT